MSPRALITSCFTVLLLFVHAMPLQAHPTSVGQTTIHVKPDTRTIDILASVKRADLAEFLKLDKDGNNISDDAEINNAREQIFTYMSGRLSSSNAGLPCAIAEHRFIPDAKSDRINLMLSRQCANPLSQLTISNTILFDDVGGHRHYARVQLGDVIQSVTFSPEFPDLKLALDPPSTPASTAPISSGETISRYTWEGILHILIGLDHVLFVFCLLLLARHTRRLLLLITSFTLGHSITLALSSLKLLIIPASVIEPIIALSILAVAIENIFLARKDQPPPQRFLLTAIFGLIHGFGFSYVLLDNVGLPDDAIALALFAFNLGVELGQLAIVAVVYPLLRAAMHKKEGYNTFVFGVSAVIALLAAWWVVERIFLA